MTLMSSRLDILRASLKRSRSTREGRPSFVEAVEPRLLLAGNLVSEPTGILPIGAAGFTLNSAPDDRFANVPVAIFADSQTSSTLSDFTATIDWGDGTAGTTGRIIRNTNDSTFYVLGTHRYTTQGQFNTAVTINHTDGRSANTAGVAFINDNTFSATTDFPGTTNPNGVWSYGSNPEGFFTFDDQLTDAGLVGWGEFDEGESEPNFLYNPTTADVTFAGVTYPPGQLAFTPGEFGENTQLLFTPTADGLYAFTALFRGLDDANATVQIRAAGNEYLNTTVTGSGIDSTQFISGAVQLIAGDPIFITVFPGPDQSNAGDTLFLDVRVTEIGLLPTLFGAGAALSVEAGQAIQNEIVATFFDTTGQSSQTDFTARVRWGDGTASNGNVTATANGGFQVVDSHTYKTEGTYNYSVIVTHTDGRRTTIDGVAVVEGGRTYTARGINVVAIEGLRTASLRVATFRDSLNVASPDDYTAQIFWGDGDTPASTGRIIDRGGGRFIVRGRHTYPFAGSFSVNVSIVDNNDVSLQASSTASVVDAPKISLRDRARFTTGQSSGQVIFSFIDVNPFADAGNYAATIDWGDDTSGQGVIQSAGGGRFDMTESSHAYASAGSYTIRIRLFEGDQPAGTFRVRAIVRDPKTAPQRV
jgi:large repetitive protein